MNKKHQPLDLFLNLAKTQALLSRRFDNGLGGLGFNEFIILFHLDQAPEKKLSRIELAQKLGLTASGITRLLLPMEKIGLIGKETHASDARISLVLLAPGGRRKLNEGLERAGLLSKALLENLKPEDIAIATKTLADLSKNA